MKNNRKIIYLAGFLFALPIALMSYINSSFLSTFVGGEKMGLAYAMASFASIAGLLVAPHVLRRMGGYKFLLLVIGLDALTVLTFVLAKQAWMILAAFILGFALNMIIVFTLDELLKIFTEKSGTGGARGAYLALANLAWIGAQGVFVFASIEGVFSFRIIYALAFVILVSFFCLVFLKLKNIPDPKYDHIKALRYVKSFFKRKNLRRSYFLNLLLQLFYSVMVIYTPIYLSVHMGMSWKQIGIIFAIMLTPFTLLPFMEGMYSDKVGERKMMMSGFLIAGAATLSIFFIRNPEIWMWALALFLTRVGAATIETMNDSYFFKHITPENEEWVGVYRSAPGVAYIIGPLSALAIFALVPSFNYIFIVLGTLMLWGIYLASTIRKGDK
ncbi:MAG: MFS transporter [bacterium]|nr:MFS transporter [bacterium]